MTETPEFILLIASLEWLVCARIYYVCIVPETVETVETEPETVETVEAVTVGEDWQVVDYSKYKTNRFLKT